MKGMKFFLHGRLIAIEYEPIYDVDLRCFRIDGGEQRERETGAGTKKGKPAIDR